MTAFIYYLCFLLSYLITFRLKRKNSTAVALHHGQMETLSPARFNYSKMENAAVISFPFHGIYYCERQSLP